MARRISTAAHRLGLAADPGVVLGYRERIDDVDLLDPRSRGPALWFQQMDKPRGQRNRIHIDIFVPHDQAEARVATALTAGGRMVDNSHAPAWWALADPEGNEVDIATWRGRD
ncbi:MAG: VOC family protein [Acidimicrobiia bacterium]